MGFLVMLMKRFVYLMQAMLLELAASQVDG